MTNWRDYVPPHRWRSCDDTYPHEPHLWEIGFDGFVCDGVEGACPVAEPFRVLDDDILKCGASREIHDAWGLVDQ